MTQTPISNCLQSVPTAKSTSSQRPENITSASTKKANSSPRNDLEGIRHFANSTRRYGVATDASLASIVAINNSSRNLNNSNNRLYHGQFRCQAVAGKMKVLYSHQLHLLSIWTLKIIQKIGKSVSICRANRSKALFGALPVTDPVSIWSNTSITFTGLRVPGRHPSETIK